MAKTLPRYKAPRSAKAEKAPAPAKAPASARLTTRQASFDAKLPSEIGLSGGQVEELIGMFTEAEKIQGRISGDAKRLRGLSRDIKKAIPDLAEPTRVRFGEAFEAEITQHARKGFTVKAGRTVRKRLLSLQDDGKEPVG